MTEITCACGCNRKKEVRTADVKRGWGKFFNKSCKAREQERRTGQYAKFKRKRRKAIERENESDFEFYNRTTHLFSSEALGQE